MNVSRYITYLKKELSRRTREYIFSPWIPMEKRLRFLTVEPQICYRSGQPRPKDFPYLCKKYGIQSVVVAKDKVKRYELEFGKTSSMGILHVQFKRDILRARHKIPPREILSNFLIFAKNMRKQKRPFLIHCRRGKDRTGLLVALYRIEVQRWTPQDAWEEMRLWGHAAFMGGSSYFKTWLQKRYNTKLV